MIILVAILDVFLAISGFVGGNSFIKDPSGSGLHMPVTWLQKTPLVKDYLWPGIFLMIAFAFGASMAALTTLSNLDWWQELNIVLGFTLMAWIIVEAVFIPEKTPLQFVYLMLGLMLVILPLL